MRNSSFALFLFCVVCLLIASSLNCISQVSLDTTSSDKAGEFYSLGEKYKGEKNYGEAARCYQKAIDFQWKFLNSVKKKSDSYTDTSNITRTIKYGFYGITVRLEDLIGRAYFQKASCRFSLADYSGAVEDFSLSIQYMDKKADNYGKAFFSRGEAYFSLGDIQRYCQDLKKAYELNVYEAAPFIRDTCN